MSGSIRKQYLTQEVFANYPEISEIYVMPKFKWTNPTAKFYLKANGKLPLLSIHTRLGFIWGSSNVVIRVAETFDSLVFENKRMIYANGKWVDV